MSAQRDLNSITFSRVFVKKKLPPCTFSAILIESYQGNANRLILNKEGEI